MDEIRPQPGPQEDFLASHADIAIAGGAYFGGKTYGELLDVLYDIGNPRMRAVYFRREMPMITAPGGLWEDACELYRRVGATFVTSPQHVVRFPSGATVTFSHMQHEDDRFNWDGAQVPLIYFDQLEQFTEKQFWHLALGRNRSSSGVVPRVRGTCNPLPDMWLSKLLQWWWDPETGYAIKERSGIIRYFLRVDNTLHWGDSPEELRAMFPGIPAEEFLPLSFTFIPSTLEDNPIGVAMNPAYAARMQNFSHVERERGRYGNWKIKDISGDGLIKMEWWIDKFIEQDVWAAMQPRLKEDWTWKRGWDLAAGDSKGADFTVGALIGKNKKDGRRLIVDLKRGRLSPLVRNEMIRNTIIADQALECINYIWRPTMNTDMHRSVGQAIAGLPHQFVQERGSKLFRAQSWSPQVEAGNYYLVRAEWNSVLIEEGAQFDGEPSTATKKDDIVDAVCLADRQHTIAE